jgi:hypothetical protein
MPTWASDLRHDRYLASVERERNACPSGTVQPPVVQCTFGFGDEIASAASNARPERNRACSSSLAG